MNGFSLLKNTNAYKVFSLDVSRGTASHAYLIVCEDELNLENYLKAFAKRLLCSESEPCGVCRNCTLIESKTHTDVVFYPTGKKILVADVDDLVKKSAYKPLECDKKVFILNGVSNMLPQAQNKLLKTLEEPPKNTYLLLGATSTYTVLSTVLSRCKRLDIPSFKEEDIVKALEGECLDRQKLLSAVRLSGGKLGEARERYESGAGALAEELAIKTFIEVTSSRDVARFSGKVTKELLKDYISSLARLTGLALRLQDHFESGDGAFYETALNLSKTLNKGALIHASDAVRKAEKDVYFNATATAVVDGVVFSILEGKHKWLK
ncbi:MAG: hypothetical protein IKL82_01190 [Clostridia bacterium]|nr:hypothetical protein [Clostridia bacterium]